jgi:hypothetical protein
MGPVAGSWWVVLTDHVGRPVTALTGCGPISGRLDKILLRPDGSMALTINGATVPVLLPAARNLRGAA